MVPEKEREWRGPFFFIQAADPQLGLMKAWREGDCDGGGDEWDEEVHLTRQVVEAINTMSPRPQFMVLCGDLVHAMPGRRKTHTHILQMSPHTSRLTPLMLDHVNLVCKNRQATTAAMNYMRQVV